MGVATNRPGSREKFLRALVVVLTASSLVACSRGSAPSPPSPPGLDLRATARVEVVGVGAPSVRADDAMLEEILAPLGRYYEGTLFGVEFPKESFEDAFAEFTPTIARVATGEQASLMTLGEVASRVKGVLEPRDITSTVTAFSAEPGRVSHAGVKVSLEAVGSLDDGTPLRVARSDFFLIERSSTGWKVISYECRQRIDAPPDSSREEVGSSGG